MKITRRQLAGAATGSVVAALAAVAIGQTPVPAQDWDKAARESHRENSEALAKFILDMPVEPAFYFKA
jgi:predicted RNA methylase